MLEIKVTKEMGRGLYASQMIFEGQVLMVCEILALSPEDTAKVNQTSLQYYTFNLNASQDCLVLGLGEIFNHADVPNACYGLEDCKGRQVMVFRALRDVKAGCQVFIDYTADVAVAVSNYVANESLVG